MKTFLATLSLAAGAALLVACRTTSINTLEPAQPAVQREMISDKRVLADSSLRKHLRILGVNTATDTAGFLKIQVEAYNATRSLKTFTYRVEWFDERGMIISLPTAAAIPRSLEGRQTGYITATAPTERAKDFRISFLEPVK
jgi:uncharacterized protein YcfL